MEIIQERCAGLDVHKKSVFVCVRLLSGRELTKEVRQYGTMTDELEQLRDWLKQLNVTHIAMEATGVFWKPIWNILEGHFELLLVNPRDIAKVPGRKTDVKDCEWITELLQHGLLRPSFVPSKTIRDLRDLTRSRTKLIDQKTSVVNRIHKVLEDANIKLSSVATDALGVSGRAMIRAIINGNNNAVVLAELAKRRLRAKIPALRRALKGTVGEHHRFLLKRYMTQLDFIESEIRLFDEHIAELISEFDEIVDLLITIDGVERRTAECIIAEIGPSMSPFPSAAALSSWAGVCPGNNRSADKRRSGKTTKGSRWLQRALMQAAWAAARSKNTYLSVQYKRLASRRGKKRAAVAVTHSILTAIYYMLKYSVPYRDLGPDHFDRLNKARLTNYLVKRLESLGHRVTLEDAA